MISKLTMAFKQVNHCAFSNPGTQVGAQNSDPDLQIRRGPDHPVPEMGGGAVSAGARSPPPPGSATAEQGFWHCFVDRLNKGLVPPVVQAIF